MNLHTMTIDQLRRAYAADLQEAFPPSELKPLSAMEALMEKGLYDPLYLPDENGEPIGYVLLWRHEDAQFVLIDYLCVPARCRNRGIGGALLAAMRDHYPAGTVFLWESEAPTGDACEDELIDRRLAFYRRCGAKQLQYDTALFGVHFKTLCFAPDDTSEQEILQKHREIYLNHFGRERYDRFIQIPLLPGERPFPITDWTEED